MRNVFLFAALLSVSACNCGDPGTNDVNDGGTDAHGDGGGLGDGGQQACIDGLQSLTIAPDNATSNVGVAPAPVTFTATAVMNDGSQKDVTSTVTWTATRTDDTAPGTFTSPGSYQPQAGVGGVVTITATDGCQTASTDVTLVLEATFNDPGATQTSRFNGTVVTNDATRTPAWVYPSDQTLFPRNIYKILFQWKRGGNDLFKLTFAGPYSTTVVYTDGKDGQCLAAVGTSGCWEADTATWQAIAGSNAGATTTVTIEGVSANDANVYRASPIQLGFSRRDVKGAIFYWSTTAAGVRRASVSDAEPEDYVVGKPVATQLQDNGGAVKCVACHTVSRSGKKMIAYTQAAQTGEFVYNVTLNPPPQQVITTQISTQKGFGTFSPDDKRVVATVGSLLKEFDADNGTKLSDLPVPAGTNPDWSPLGFEVAYSNKGGDSPGGANLDVIGNDGGVWGPIRTLVPSGGLTNLFPSYSPDGQYVAYARGKGGHGDNTLQLWLVKADGSEQPIELKNANRVVNSQMTAGQHENNMPTWAPPGDYDWIAFNSVRSYGVVYPNGGTQQIWVAAVDRNKLAAGQDPSFPAFRFAFQGLAENNHRAFWTLDVRDPPDGGTTCASLGKPCDASGVECCAGTVCAATEIGMSCQPPPPDGGTCLAVGASCDQLNDQCCAGTVCDVQPDGGATQCRSPIIN